VTDARLITNGEAGSSVRAKLNFDRAAVFNAQEYGWLPDGTNRSAQALDLLAKAYDAGGGTIFFPPSIGRYRCDAQLLLPNNGASPQPQQPNVRFAGAGGGSNWYEQTIAQDSAAILDLRYTSTGGKIETLGVGSLMIDGLQITDGGSSNSTPLLHTTNTVLTVKHNSFVGVGNATQDAIVLGGSSTTFGGGATTDAFQGYGTLVEFNSFTKMNRGLYIRTYANDTYCNYNIFSKNTGTCAIESDGGDGNPPNNNEGLYVANNIIEMAVGYVYGIKLKSTRKSMFINNAFWDQGAQVLGEYYLDTGAFYNTFLIGHSESLTKRFVGDATSMATSTIMGASTGVTETSGEGIAASEFAGGLVAKGNYDSSRSVPGQFRVSAEFAPEQCISFGVNRDAATIAEMDALNSGGSGYPLRINRSGGSLILGNAALATNAANGFPYIPTCAGTPTGTPTGYTGSVPMVYDTTNHKLYVYDGGWKTSGALS
jgi:hypothetical protein